jgi:uncharacterized protein DUF4333
MRRPGRWAVAAVALALGPAACGQSSLDTSQAERVIAKGLERQTGVKIETVKCPHDVEVGRGKRFRCAVVPLTGRQTSVVVTQRDDDGTITWRVARAPEIP